jgi:hypothetical protein
MYDTAVFAVFFNFQMTNAFPGSRTLSDDWVPSCLLTVASAAILVQISYLLFAPLPYSFGLLKYKSYGRISDLTKPTGRTLFSTNHDWIHGYATTVKFQLPTGDQAVASLLPAYAVPFSRLLSTDKRNGVKSENATKKCTRNNSESEIVSQQPHYPFSLCDKSGFDINTIKKHG